MFHSSNQQGACTDTQGQNIQVISKENMNILK